MSFNNVSAAEQQAFAVQHEIDLDQSNKNIQEVVNQRIQKIEEKLKNPNLSESDQAQLRQEMALECAKTGDLKRFYVFFDTIGQKSISQDLLFQLDAAVIRIAILKNDQQLFEKHLAQINTYKNLSFDNNSQLEIYQAVSILLFKAPHLKFIRQVAPLLTNNISTFSAESLMSFEEFIVTSFVIAICKFSRKELQALIDKQMDNFNYVLSNKVCKILLDVVNCQYEGFQNAVELLRTEVKMNFYVSKYAEVLVDLFKAKVYEQYLKTYNSVALDKISFDLKVDKSQLINELEYFIFTDQLKAKMNEAMLIKVNDDTCTDLFNKFYDAANKLVTKVEIAQRK
ncbi:26S_proteasome non-ATPase regulatory subunit 6 [Hexamita inflata]|uniref:26S proteasome non-ATPase regulatory subunit 6 n=1 Tax=Hexamita inflata TaxID=28002 RepID=A0AA86VUN9_9EUKA|nr:26S proteasome non-ATPase regulatory subunit 6 [Hexamita inflata]